MPSPAFTMADLRVHDGRSGRSRWSEIRSQAGKNGLEVALRNGLSPAENEELVRARDGRRIVELILKGLAALPDPTAVQLYTDPGRHFHDA